MRHSIFSRKIIPVYVFPILFYLLFSTFINRSFSKAKEPTISDQKNAPVVLQLKWFHQFQFAGYYAALHEGFFKEEGLDVIIKAGGPRVKVDEEIISDRAHYGVLASELIQKKAQGQPLVLLAAIMQHSIRAIIVRTDSGINAPSDFIGQRIMINQNEDAEFTAMFVAEGVPLNKLNIIPKDKTANNKFIKGEIDGLNGSIGNQPFVFQGKGIPVKTIRPISYGIDFYGDSLFTSETELKKHPDRVAAFRRAVVRGWEYAMEHDSEIIDLILTEYTSTKDRAHLQFEADAIRKLILPQLVDIGHISFHRVERIAQFYASQKIIPQDFSLEGFIYDPTPPTNKKFIRLLLTGFSALVIVAVVCSVILIYFNKRLRKLVHLRTRELTFVNENLLRAVETRKKAEDTITVKEARLKDTQRIARLGSWELDTLNNKIWWSDETYRLFDLQVEDEITFEKFIDLIHPDDRKNVENLITQSIDKGSNLEINYRILLPSGDIRYFHEKSRAVYNDESTEIIQRIGSVQDVTDRIKAEEEIKRLQGLLPICMHCKKIRDDQGVWNQIEQYIDERSDVKFSHGCCPDCLAEHYPEYASIDPGNSK